MPSITINGRKCDFSPGQMILQVANANGVEIPQYCYHDGLSIVASCRICLAECHAPNPKTGAIEPYMGGKLLPTCQTPAVDGMVVYSDSPKAVANQKGVMEYLLINHPLDCPVCDQSGECFLQDYSYLYGRGVSRFEESKVKQAKKDLGPHVYLYSDRCIMCTRCVRFTNEVSGTGELGVVGRGNKEEIDVFPGVPIANELSGNVIDLCPVGALLDKDFLFAQRVWLLKETPSIDGLTASGDNISIHSNDGKVYRVKPRTNMKVNKWWITDEVRYGWKFVHSRDRLREPGRKQYGVPVGADYDRAYDDLIAGVKAATGAGKRLAVLVSPMLSCEDAFALVKAGKALDPQALFAVGPVPRVGEDKVFPIGAKADSPRAFTMRADKAPNARGVRRVLGAILGEQLVQDYNGFLRALGHGTGASGVGAVLLTGNYPSAWATDDLIASLAGKFIALADTLAGMLSDRADIVLPTATWTEKAGTFENAAGMLQAFEAAIPTQHMSKSEGQHAWDILATLAGAPPQLDDTEEMVVISAPGQVAGAATIAKAKGPVFNAAQVRQQMAEAFPALRVFVTDVVVPSPGPSQEADAAMVEL